ncbi:MAG: metallophosphoesterase [Fidelibacterota bacterium]
MSARYYEKTWQVAGNTEVLLLFIDTVPLIDKYRNNPEEYRDACTQSMERQLTWIDSTLGASGAKWKIVLGHHPIYAGTYKDDIERTDLQKRLQPLLDKHHVDFVVSGHIHNFQHIRVKGSDIDYLINTSGSQAREADERHRTEGQLFTSSDSGFSLCTVKEDELIITFVNKKGEIIYQYARSK